MSDPPSLPILSNVATDGARADYVASTLRERIVEHVFVGEVLRRLWRRGVLDVEVLRSEFDAGGYDLVLSHGRVLRHIQLKASRLGGKRASVSVGLALAAKPSGCVIWIVVTPELDLHHFLWFGGMPGAPLPDLSSLKIARHSKGDAAGAKAERPNHRLVPRSRFERLEGMDAVLERLFGLALDGV